MVDFNKLRQSFGYSLNKAANTYAGVMDSAATSMRESRLKHHAQAKVVRKTHLKSVKKTKRVHRKHVKSYGKTITIRVN